ncbi:MAG: siderophore ABC transporter substrate-binding protein [Rhodobacteraceae bacterium]|nr:siderophore ABC transporter substrate-binding protein [Paracoccaceae bacterium]
MNQLALTGLVTVFSAGFALAEDVTVATARGDVLVPLMPETVLVFDISAIDTLAALGVQPAGVISNLYVSYLDDISANAEVVGSLFEPDFEAVNAIEPDLIIVGSRSAEQVDALSEFSVAIDMTIWGDDIVGQALARLEAYGAIFDKTAEADALATDFNAALTAAQAATNNAGTALIVMTNGPKVSAYGPGSRFGWLHTTLGITPAIEDVEAATHGEAISFEFIRDANPDWLIVIDRVAAIGAEGDSAQTTLDNVLVAETTAWQNGQVIYLDSASIYVAGGGIQSMKAVIDTIAAAFGGAS